LPVTPPARRRRPQDSFTKAGEINLTVRLWKRMLAVVALTFLIAGVTLVALARFNGKVI
jgi:hypothetical protein